MRIALVESCIAWEDKEKNISRFTNQLKQLHALAERVDMFLLPEMSFTGFSLNIDKNAEIDFTCNEMRRLSRNYAAAIGFGWIKKYINEAGNEKAQNHYSIAYDNGNRLHDYVKLHPFSYSGENKYFEGGSDIAISQIGEFSFGTAICYDLRFPEIFQAMSKSAQAIVVPANWPAKRQTHFEKLLAARAIENQCYILAINCKGSIGGLMYDGGSCVINPIGEKIKPEGVFEISGDTISIYNIKNDVSNVREAFPVRNDRRIDLYKRML